MKTPPSKALERLVSASAVFDVDGYTLLTNESELRLDPAAQEAIQKQAALVIVFRQVKRRHREAAASETRRCVLEGYKMTRYVLSTWQTEVSYSTPRTAVANAKRLSDRMDLYPSIETLMPSLAPEFRRFITDRAMSNASGSILETLFELKKAEGLALTSIIDGVYIGLAEDDEFL